MISVIESFVDQTQRLNFISTFFVAYLKVGKNSTSLVFCDNGEIIFSCNNRDLGISRISGTMTLSRNKALKKIEKIFSCLD